MKKQPSFGAGMALGMAVGFLFAVFLYNLDSKRQDYQVLKDEFNLGFSDGYTLGFEEGQDECSEVEP